MGKEALLSNMQDQIKEAQLKLGYVRETVRLYYPLTSLNELMGTQISEGEEMVGLLRRSFAGECVLGPLTFALHGENIEVGVPPRGVEYVCLHVEAPAFLSALIALLEAGPHCSPQDICGLFARFDREYVCERLSLEAAGKLGFDMALHFSDPGIDGYYYCLKEEMGHIVYHRFTPGDFERIRSEAGV